MTLRADNDTRLNIKFLSLKSKLIFDPFLIEKLKVLQNILDGVSANLSPKYERF